MIKPWLRSIGIALAAAAIFGCTSPEAERTRGGGPGADVGNHPVRPVELHGGANMYYGTRTDGAGIGRHTLIGGAVSAEAR